jgi:protein gp37
VGDTTISWTRGDDGSPGKTWNPVRGCTKISRGCAHCYASTFAERWRGVPGHPFEQGFDLRLVPEALELPLRWRRPRRVFVNSMSDLFHEGVPDEFIAAVFGVMASCPQHTFQVLTKRPDRMRRWFDWVQQPRSCAVDAWVQHCAGQHTDRIRLHPLKGTYLCYPWPLPNVWLGVSVEDQRAADERIPELLHTPAAVRFLSCEPLLGPVDLTRLQGGVSIGEHVDLCVDALAGRYAAAWHGRKTVPDRPLAQLGAGGISWVIVGGESGPGARPCDVAWVRSLVAQCGAAGVPAFTKQLGSHIVASGAAQYGWPIDTAPGLTSDTTVVPTRIRVQDRAGRDPAEWPHDLRVQQFPEVRP